MIINAAISNNYAIVRMLYADGYKIWDKMADDRFFFSEGQFNFTSITIWIKLFSSWNKNSDASFFDPESKVERHIDRIRVFRAMASPAYMAMTYMKVNKYSWELNTSYALSIYTMS